jgi:hypothetical protein
MLNIACGIMIYGRIWGGEPPSKHFPRLVHCEAFQLSVYEGSMKGERTFKFIHFCLEHNRQIGRLIYDK